MHLFQSSIEACRFDRDNERCRTNASWVTCRTTHQSLGSFQFWSVVQSFCCLFLTERWKSSKCVCAQNFCDRYFVQWVLRKTSAKLRGTQLRYPSEGQLPNNFQIIYNVRLKTRRFPQAQYHSADVWHCNETVFSSWSKWLEQELTAPKSFGMHFPVAMSFNYGAPLSKFEKLPIPIENRSAVSSWELKSLRCCLYLVPCSIHQGCTKITFHFGLTALHT